MKFFLRGFTCDELDYRMNKIKIEPNTKIEIKPQFSRELKVANDNPKINIVSLSVRIESSALEPKPFNLYGNINGIFEIEQMEEFERRQFIIEATRILYPYLRNMVSQLTAIAFVSPILLPALDGGVLFPEDRIPQNDVKVVD